MIHTNKETIKYPFSNHIIFAMVMDDPDLCKELIQRIFPDRKVKKIIIKEHPAAIVKQPSVITEATLLTGPDTKSIRLDVLFEDGTAWWDVEMQTVLEEELPKRGRYYASVTDTKILGIGDEYKNLKPSFIIFLCRFDYYKKGEPIYSFQRYDPDLGLPFGDESYIIMLAIASKPAEAGEALHKFA